MTQLQLEKNGTFGLGQAGKAPLFTGGTLQTREVGGDWESQLPTLPGPGASVPENQLGYQSDSLCESNLSLLHGAGGFALKAGLRLHRREPRFTRQRFFSGTGAARVTLTLPETGPMLAIYQHKDWWCRPAFPQAAAEVPPRTQLLLWQGGGLWRALMVCTGDHYRGDIEGIPGGLRVTLSSNCDQLDTCDAPLLALAEGPDPYACCEAAAGLLLAAGGRSHWPLRRDKQYPALFEKLGWCSWDAFYHEVNAEGILEKLRELREKNIPVGWVLIDDGWSEADYEKQQLTGLDARENRFPGGLAQTVEAIHGILPEAQVGVWHAAMGYWNGVQPDSPAHLALQRNLRRLPDGRLVPAANPGENFALWDAWHSHLKSQGIRFAKVDGQSAISLFHWGNISYGEACGAFHAGLEASAHTHFGGGLINCMGMASQDVWNRPASTISRCSDDFVPDTPNSFAEHALQNAYNALWLGLFDWCDLDMFWSDHTENRRNSLLRAVGGGPVYISDKVGKSDPAWISPLVLGDGTLLRCESVCRPTPDCLLADPTGAGRVLKVFNRYKDSYVVAGFNFGEAPAETLLAVTGLPGAEARAGWLLYDHFAGTVRPLPLGGETVTLAPGGSQLWLLLPREQTVTAIGLADKYLSCAGIAAHTVCENTHSWQLRQGGRFAFHTTSAPSRVLVDGQPADCTQNGDCYTVDCTGEAPTVSVIL